MEVYIRDIGVGAAFCSRYNACLRLDGLPRVVFLPVVERDSGAGTETVARCGDCVLHRHRFRRPRQLATVRPFLCEVRPSSQRELWPRGTPGYNLKCVLRFFSPVDRIPVSCRGMVCLPTPFPALCTSNSFLAGFL